MAVPEQAFYRADQNNPLSHLRPNERKQVTTAAMTRVTAMLHRTEEAELPAASSSSAASERTSHLQERVKVLVQCRFLKIRNQFTLSFYKVKNCQSKIDSFFSILFDDSFGH